MIAIIAAFGKGTGPILLNIVGCTGTESSLLNCSHRELDAYYFYHFLLCYYIDYNDVGVVCPSCKSCFNTKVVTSELLSWLNMLGVTNCGYYDNANTSLYTMGSVILWSYSSLMASYSLSVSYQFKNVLHSHSSVYAWDYEIAIPNIVKRILWYI